MADFAAYRDAHLLYDLRGLPRAATVLHVGTHPDDEETGLLTYLARGCGVRTVYWSATRGEGGQNRLGAERQEALGVLRTWESLSACEINGAEALYGPFYDFGFSKSADDTMSRWGHERVIREIVRAIWTVRPQVIIARWSGGPSDGHGQHQAIGVATRAAFDAAGDADRFPQLLEQGLIPWQPLKLYHSMAGDWQPGEDDEFGLPNEAHERAGLLRLDTGAYDPVAGRSFQEQASIAWNRHRTQALAFLPEWREFVLYYRLIESRVPLTGAREEDFFEGVDTSLAGSVEHLAPDWSDLRALLTEAERHAELAVETFHPFARDKTAAILLEGLAALRTAADRTDERTRDDAGLRAIGHWLGAKIRAFERAISRLLGLDAACLLERARVTPGESFKVTATVTNKHGPAVTIRELRLDVPDGWTRSPVVAGNPRERLERGETLAVTFDVSAPTSARYSTPYWLREPRDAYAYHWPDEGTVGTPFDEPLVSLACDADLGAQRVTLTAAGVRREGFPGGYRELPLSLRPPIDLEPRERRALLPVDDGTQHIDLQVTARCLCPGGARGILTLESPEGWRVSPQSVELAFALGGEGQTARFEVDIPGGAAGAHELRYWVSGEGARDSVVLQPVRQLAPGLPGPPSEATCVSEVFIAAPAAVAVNVVDARFVRTLRYGYVEGADEELVSALSDFGLDVHALSDEELAFGDLDRFDPIIVGPNAYLLRPALAHNAQRLLDHVARGGTMIVQYQAYGYADGGFAPHPLRYNQPHDRVTLAQAPVSILETGHPALSSPNPIDARDFDGWVHDRGMYFLGEWDRRYTALLASADPGEEPKRGGLLVASHGRGTYVYAAYSFFRQVPAGVQGAVRLFANLIGLSEARLLERVERLRTVPLFATMSEAEVQRIAQLVSEEWFDDRAFLARQGESGRELYLVLEGAVEVLREVESQWDVVYVASPGDVIGEVAPLAELPRSASLRARGDTRVLLMRGEDLRSLIDDSPELSQDLLRILARRLARDGFADV